MLDKVEARLLKFSDTRIRRFDLSLWITGNP